MGQSMKTKQVTVQYRYLKTEGLWDDIHLKDMVVDILRRTPSGRDGNYGEQVRHRIIDLDSDGGVVLLNKMSEPAHWDTQVFCGQLLHIRSGTEVSAITSSLESDISEHELKQMSLGKDNRVVDGVMYFALVHNHVGLIQAGKSTPRSLERYLTRLFQDAGEFEQGQVVTLNAQLEGVTADKVEKVTVSPHRALGANTVIEDEQRAAGSADGTGKTVFDVLAALGWRPEDIQHLQDSVPEGGWIEGKFNMMFKRKGGRKSAIERSALEEALRNLDPHSVGLLDPSGTREGGGLAKLSKSARVLVDGELLEPTSAMKEIVMVLKGWACAGKIDCDFE